METWEIERRIEELQIKLDYLSETVETSYHQAYGTDVKYEYGERTRGSKSEIESIKAQIAQYEKKLADRKMIKEQKKENPQMSAIDYEQETKKQEQARKREAELKRVETFKEIKKIYQQRKGYGFRKIIDRLSGNGPKWKNVKKYSQEELDFVLKTLSGETTFGKSRYERIAESRATEKEKAEKIKKGNWDNFTAVLNSKYKLNNQLEI